MPLKSPFNALKRLLNASETVCPKSATMATTGSTAARGATISTAARTAPKILPSILGPGLFLPASGTCHVWPAPVRFPGNRGNRGVARKGGDPAECGTGRQAQSPVLLRPVRSLSLRERDAKNPKRRTSPDPLNSSISGSVGRSKYVAIPL